MEHRKSWQIPSFGNWDYGDELPFTQYFESARQAGLLRSGLHYEEDLFNVPVAMPVNLAYRTKLMKVNDCGGGEKQSKQGRRKDVNPMRKTVAAPKAIDEDLYKIPPELHQKPKKNSFLRNLFSGCLGLTCIVCA